VRIPLLLYAFAFVVRLALAAGFPDPAYPDSYYYVDVGRALASGHGLNVDFIWIFGEVGGRIPPNPTLPVPSNAHWLPLSSMIQAASMTLLGQNAWASALPLIAIGSLVAPLVWFIGGEAGCSKPVRLGAAVLAGAPGAGAVFMPQPENFAILQPLIAATIYLVARGLKGHPRSYMAAGVLVAFASLARNDGIFLGLAVGLVWFIDRGRAWLSKGALQPRLPFAAAVGCFALYVLVMAPWWIRQLEVFGSISPTASSGNALWLRNMDEWNSITIVPTIGRFLDQGLPTILQHQFFGLVAAIGNFAVVIGSVVLVPFILVGAWRRRHSTDFQPWFLYAVVVFLAAAIIYPVHVPGGAFIHSAIGLSGHAYLLALEGVVAFVAWIGRRRPSWDVERASRIFITATVAFVLLLIPVFSSAVHDSWQVSVQPRQTLARALDELGVGPNERLLSIDAAGMKYWTGRPGVVTPNDPIETIEQVARAYDTTWLIVERDDAAAALGPVLAGTLRPDWIGPPVLVVPAADGGIPRLARFPVCTSAGDDRCSNPPVLANR
jgi:hypothetical protein